MNKSYTGKHCERKEMRWKKCLFVGLFPLALLSSVIVACLIYEIGFAYFIFPACILCAIVWVCWLRWTECYIQCGGLNAIVMTVAFFVCITSLTLTSVSYVVWFTICITCVVIRFFHTPCHRHKTILLLKKNWRAASPLRT